MKIRYDLHVHSGLSPCADDDMTPVNIVGYAKLKGLDMVAVADHNSFLNVEVAMKAGEFYGVTVIPAFELQTNEDIHVLCLFENLFSLKEFYKTLKFITIDNEPSVFGNQNIYDEDDNVTGIVKELLLVSSTISSEDVFENVKKFGGVAIPAHVDREANGMLAILGAISGGYEAVEFSGRADKRMIEEYEKKYVTIVDSDAHTLSDIDAGGEAELYENSVKAMLEYLRGRK